MLEMHHRDVFRRTLPGLSAGETREFYHLDDSVPFGGMQVWPTTGLPSMAQEERWRELWLKQQTGD